MNKDDLLKRPVVHLDPTAFDARPIIDAYRGMAFQARNLASAADIVVEPSDLAAVEVVPETVALRAGETQSFSAVGMDAFGNEVDFEPLWNVEGDVGSIEGEGMFTAAHAGSGRVVALTGPSARAPRSTTSM